METFAARLRLVDILYDDWRRPGFIADQIGARLRDRRYVGMAEAVLVTSQSPRVVPSVRNQFSSVVRYVASAGKPMWSWDTAWRQFLIRVPEACNHEDYSRIVGRHS